MLAKYGFRSMFAAALAVDVFGQNRSVVQPCPQLCRFLAQD